MYRFIPFGKLFHHNMSSQPTKIVRKRRLDSQRAKRQQQDRRKESLFKKAYEYSLEYDADVYISIRIKRNGKIFTFNSDLTQEWPVSEAQMVRHSLSGSSIFIIRNTKIKQNKCYPLPVRITPENFEVMACQAPTRERWQKSSSLLSARPTALSSLSP